MASRTVSIPELGLIAGTRAALGAGIGLLLANQLSSEQRRAVGWTLLAVGVVTTFPLAAEVIFRHSSSTSPARRDGVEASQEIEPAIPVM